jgi:hypothetical protein
MTARRLTRRSMLAATGGAVVGAMMRPVEGLAALAGQPPPALGERWL